jgi:hypothetical protein
MISNLEKMMQPELKVSLMARTGAGCYRRSSAVSLIAYVVKSTEGNCSAKVMNSALGLLAAYQSGYSSLPGFTLITTSPA